MNGPIFQKFKLAANSNKIEKNRVILVKIWLQIGPFGIFGSLNLRKFVYALGSTFKFPTAHRFLPKLYLSTRVPIYWEFGQLAKILHFVSKLDTSLYSKSMGNSCQLSYYCVPFENEAVKPI